MVKNTPQLDYPHPTINNASKFAIDDLLRSKDFIIHSRPKDGEPLWARCGRIYTQSEALHLFDPGLIEDALYAEKLRREGYE